MALALAVPVVVSPTAAGLSDAPRQKGSGGVSDALLVAFRRSVTDADAAAALSAVGGSQVGHFEESGVRVVAAPAGRRESVRAALLADARVVSVEDDATVSATVTPNDRFWGRQWGSRRVRAPIAWKSTRGDRSAIIAIVDTGVDRNHPDLRGRVLRGWDFHNDDAKPDDDDGHGTAVATTAAGQGNDRVGVAGMCWRCRILPVKVLNGNGRGTHSNIAAGIIWATDRGANVINLSIAGLGSTMALRRSIEYAIRRGVIVVAAAGNSGSSRRNYPAAYPGVVSVAATNESDRLYSWSNHGRWVTLAAPGCAYSGRPRGRWAWLCGTSLSTPAVAGTLGLMKSIAPRLGRSRLTSLLTRNSQRVRARVGHGRLDAARAVKSVVSLLAAKSGKSGKSRGAHLGGSASSAESAGVRSAGVTGSAGVAGSAEVPRLADVRRSARGAGRWPASADGDPTSSTPSHGRGAPAGHHRPTQARPKSRGAPPADAAWTDVPRVQRVHSRGPARVLYGRRGNGRSVGITAPHVRGEHWLASGHQRRGAVRDEARVKQEGGGSSPPPG